MDEWLHHTYLEPSLPTRFVPVSEPRPVVTLADLEADDVDLAGGPAGSMPVTKVDEVRRFNMMDSPFRDTALWPATRPRKTPLQQVDKRWFHGDYKDAPYLLTHGLYLKIVNIVQ